MKSCSIQPLRSGRGGTEYTIKERLLAGSKGVQMGLASRHDWSDRDTPDRVRWQTSFLLSPVTSDDINDMPLPPAICADGRVVKGILFM